VRSGAWRWEAVERRRLSGHLKPGAEVGVRNARTGSRGVGSGGEPLQTRVERDRTETIRAAPCTVGIDTDDTSGVYGNHQCVHKTLNFVNCSAAAYHFHLKVPNEVRAALLLPRISYRSALIAGRRLPGLRRADAPRQTGPFMTARACRRGRRLLALSSGRAVRWR
jgi:hypothetical protein